MFSLKNLAHKGLKVSIVPADDPALLVTGISAGTVMTKFIQENMATCWDKIQVWYIFYRHRKT